MQQPKRQDMVHDGEWKGRRPQEECVFTVAPLIGCQRILCVVLSMHKNEAYPLYCTILVPHYVLLHETPPASPTQLERF